MIKFFKDDHRFLSNFFPAPVEFEDVVYPSTENAYQAAKTLDGILRSNLLHMTAGQAKRFAEKNITKREDWRDINLQLMYELNLQKFSKYDNLKQLLLATGDEVLEEGNYWHDNFWGNCYCPKCVDIKGENHLGKILMKVREELKK